jgi:hypothetical protein
VSLPGGFNQSLTPWAKDVAPVELQLPSQFLDDLFVLLDGLIMEFGSFFKRGLEVLNLLTVKLRRLIERSVEILNLLSEPLQEGVTFARISGP